MTAVAMGSWENAGQRTPCTAVSARYAAGVKKASGMQYALRKLGSSVHEAVGSVMPRTITRFLNDVVILVGPSPDKTLESFTAATEQTVTWPAGLSHQNGHVVVWFSRSGKAPFSMRLLPGRVERIHHLRKYAEGNMRNRSFYFRGPARRHNLRAQNLVIFSQIADGIDEETWLYHLYRGDFSRWFAML